jgi:hypothetical protein
MKTKYAAWFAFVAVALSVGWYLWGSRHGPRGQPPLTSLTSTNLDQFKTAFNGAADRNRLVLLLSPT